MAYLILNDYYAQIQIINLNQVIGGDNTKLTSAASKAQEQCESYLIQKYDLSNEFTDTNVWSFSRSYNANDRIYLDAAAYDPSLTYALNNLTLQGGNVYLCSVAIVAPEAFNAGHWTLLGAQNTIFFAEYPKPVFDYQSCYSVGDQVFWKNKVYTCLIKTIIPGHDAQLQRGTIQNQPFINVFPDDVSSGLLYWGVGATYSVAAGTLPTNGNYWTNGDNRSQQLLEVLIDLTLYKIHSRISPRNIPDLRVKNYDEAISWLKAARAGDVTAKLPTIQPVQGRRIRYGGNVKNVNSY
jgi:hypothetical protein